MEESPEAASTPAATTPYVAEVEEEFTWDLQPDFDAEEFVRGLRVTAEQRDAIAAYPQRSVDWKRARCGRGTASNFAAMLGGEWHLPGAQKQVLAAMLWPDRFKLEGMAAKFAAWGTANEPVARDVYIAHRRAQLDAAQPGSGRYLNVYETGLLVSREFGYLAASPDFVVQEPLFGHEGGPAPSSCANPHHAREPYCILGSEYRALEADVLPHDPSAPPLALTPSRLWTGCGEIKCPATKTLYSLAPKHGEHGLPRYYWIQIQGQMALNAWPWCDVVVYTPEVTQVTRFHFNAQFWEDVLLPGLQSFYFGTYLPRLTLRAKGRLAPGEVDPPPVLLRPVQALVMDPGYVERLRQLKLKRKQDREQARARARGPGQKRARAVPPSTPRTPRTPGAPSSTPSTDVDYEALVSAWEGAGGGHGVAADVGDAAPPMKVPGEMNSAPA
jgi:hypothetical protein